MGQLAAILIHLRNFRYVFMVNFFSDYILFESIHTKKLHSIIRVEIHEVVKNKKDLNDITAVPFSMFF